MGHHRPGTEFLSPAGRFLLGAGRPSLTPPVTCHLLGAGKRHYQHPGGPQDWLPDGMAGPCSQIIQDWSQQGHCVMSAPPSMSSPHILRESGPVSQSSHLRPLPQEAVLATGPSEVSPSCECSGGWACALSLTGWAGSCRGRGSAGDGLGAGGLLPRCPGTMRFPAVPSSPAV